MNRKKLDELYYKGLNEHIAKQKNMETLKANELRTGNLLMHDGEVVVIDSIQQSLLSVKGNNYWELMKDFEPIPLTEDWLVKFGFEKEENNWYKLSICNDWTYLYWEKLAGIELSVNKHSVMQPHIKYVHQLQNLYFALTGTELEF